MDEVKRIGSWNSHPTIGLLVDWLEDGYQVSVVSGVVNVVRERGINLICAVGGRLFSPYGFDAQRNVLYKLVGKENVDGLVILSGTLTNDVSLEEMRKLCQRYHPLPMVSIALAMEGIPGVLIDNRKGLHDAIVHLIEVHSCRRIAFIRGPADSPEAEQRYHVYTDVLADYGLPFDPDLVTLGDFQQPSGAEAVHLLLDQRKVDLDAVVASNDNMALGALEALQARGNRVPYDVALVGFDDIEAASAVTPALSTVRQPLFELGEQAAEVLLALLAGEEAPQQVVLPTELVVRQSCGCLDSAVVRAAAGPLSGTSETFEAVLAAQRDTIVAEMVHEIEAPSADMASEWAEQLLDAFSAGLKGEPSSIFLIALDQVLVQAAAVTGSDVASWQGALSAMRRYVWPSLTHDSAGLSRAEDLWQQGRVLIGAMARQVQAHRSLQAEQRTRTLGEVIGELIITSDLTQLADVAAQVLPRLGIQSCYISLYDGPGMPAEWAWLILAYDEKGRIELEPGRQRFPSRQLVPRSVLPNRTSLAFVLVPLYFREDQLGFALIEMVHQEGAIYETLRSQLSSALKGTLLLTENVRARDELQKAKDALEKQNTRLEALYRVGQLVNSTLEAEAILDRLTEEAMRVTRATHGQVLVVREEAGCFERRSLRGFSTEEAGLARTIPLPLDLGINGRVYTTRQAVRVDDVRNGQGYFPLIPSTRTELAVPIMRAGRVLGNLDLQSPEVGAFRDADLDYLNALADQVAIALTNAQVFQVVEQARRELERSNQELQQFAYIASHDLQEPLRMVRSYLQLLERRYKNKLDTDADEFIAYAVDGAARMQTLINDLLTYSRVGTRGKPFQPTDCAEVLKRVLTNLAVAIEESKAVVTYDALPTVLADDVQLMQLFQNLIGNAVKFRGERTPEVHAGVERKDGEWQFSVRDNGIGIDPQQFGRLFMIFQRLHTRVEYPGTGIGLAVCKKIVERHGGCIWVESEPDKGSTFYFTIPGGSD